MAPSIRLATPADADTIADFNYLLAKESEDKTLDRAVLNAGVRAGLADTQKALYFVAEENGVILGQTMITYEWSDWRNGWIWWIQSVYVRPEARQRGVFRSIFEYIAAKAKRHGVVGIRLYVEKENQRAHETYLKLGLQWAGYQVMERMPL